MGNICMCVNAIIFIMSDIRKKNYIQNIWKNAIHTNMEINNKEQIVFIIWFLMLWNLLPFSTNIFPIETHKI